jgi:undecaprenyl-diphosphatase
MTVPEGVALGVVQGLTEFLPVSSSGHLALAESLLGVHTPGVRFEVLVHLATALAVILYFRRRIGAVLTALAGWPFRRRSQAGPGAGARDAERAADARLGLNLALGTVPAAVVGYLFESRVEAAFDDPRLVSALLIVTGFILWATRLVRRPGRAVETWRDALLVGAGQAVAVLPGISRSGTTIATGLLAGLDRRRAAEFGFLLSVPIILGAGAVGLGGAVREGTLGVADGVGAATAFICALPAIAVLMRVAIAGRIHLFSWYCWAVGAAGVVLTTIR